MRDELPLKELLMSYARQGAERALQPDSDQIRRRGRRHYRRVAALSVTGLLLAAGLGVGLVYGRGTTPTVNRPPVTNPAPPAPQTTTPPPATTITSPTGAATGDVPGTYVASIGDRVAVISQATGKVIRTLWRPHRAGTQVGAVGLSSDRKTVYFSAGYSIGAGGSYLCDEPGVFRVSFNGGPVAKVVTDEIAVGLIATSADGSKLAYLAHSCLSSSFTGADIVLRDAGGTLLHRWSSATAGAGPGPEVLVPAISLSPDGRQLTVPVFMQVSPLGVLVLDASRGTSISDGRLLQAPDPGCRVVNAAFQPRTGQLAAFERCPPNDPQSGGVPRFRLVYLDPVSGRLLSRSLALDDHSGADLHIDSMDFDQTGRYLLYAVGSADPADSQQPSPQTGTWWYTGGQPIRVHDDQRVGSGSTSYLITSAAPSW
jgi:hypothetical protein